ncbi:hypothetical protein FXO37_17498 [Capsicum annuum]|nr:hypothetical protein FXO37_17498 [Capsicum annuum]
MKLVESLRSQDGAGLLNAVRVSYRLLLAEPEVFVTMWDWSCLLDNISQFHDFYLGRNEEPNRSECDILCWEEYCQDVALEKAAWYLESSHESNRDLAGGSTRFNQCQSLHSSPFDSLVPSSSTILEYGLLKGDKKVTWDCGKPFVLTSAMQKSYEMVFLAFSQRWPVLLYGPAGSGKTALISKLAELHGGRDMSESGVKGDGLGSLAYCGASEPFKWLDELNIYILSFFRNSCTIDEKQV